MSLSEKMAAKIASKASLSPTPSEATTLPKISLSAKLLEKFKTPFRSNSRVGVIMKASGVSRTREFDRIFNLPRRVLDLNNVRDLTDMFRKTAVDCSCGKEMRLWPIQNAALAEAAAQGGLFGALAVGSGKTLISLLVGQAMNAQRIVLLVPSEIRNQLLTRDIPHLAKHFALEQERLTVVSYSELSTARTGDALERLKPDLIVADECHRISRRDSARTKRFERYMKEHPECAFVGLSGTMTKDSIRNYARFMELSLRKNSPMPGNYREIMEWSEALDDIRHGDPREARGPGALILLCNEGESTRSGYRRRWTETPGCVATSEGSLGTTLYLRAVKPVVPHSVTRAIEKLENTWSVGEGDDREELVDALAIARIKRQLSCGFYYKWRWPDNNPDREWLDARREWNIAVRQFLKRRAKAGCDSPLLVTNAIKRGDIPDLESVCSAWQAVYDRPEPPVEPVWIDKFIVDYGEQWLCDQLKDGKRSILWIEHQAIETEIRQRHIKTFGAGEDAGEVFSKNFPVIACSIISQSTGKNLQGQHRGEGDDGWNHNLVLSPPPSALTWEQLIARTHRPGQEKDEVFVDVCQHTEVYKAAMALSVMQARTLEERDGQKQKITSYATRIGFED